MLPPVRSDRLLLSMPTAKASLESGSATAQIDPRVGETPPRGRLGDRRRNVLHAPRSGLDYRPYLRKAPVASIETGRMGCAPIRCHSPTALSYTSATRGLHGSSKVFDAVEWTIHCHPDITRKGADDAVHPVRRDVDVSPSSSIGSTALISQGGGTTDDTLGFCSMFRAFWRFLRVITYTTRSRPVPVMRYATPAELGLLSAPTVDGTAKFRFRRCPSTGSAVSRGRFTCRSERLIADPAPLVVIDPRARAVHPGMGCGRRGYRA